MAATTKRRRPIKYLDKDKVVVNPAWLELRRAEEEAGVLSLGPGQHEVYYPEEHGKLIPEEGAWIRVLMPPFTVLSKDFEVPRLSMWRARPHVLNSGGHGSLRPHQAVIATPAGDLHLWPYEYQIVEDITPFVGADPDVIMHQLNGQPLFGEDDDHLFYLQSRGIPRHEAALLLLNSQRSTDFVWFEMHPDYLEIFEGVGDPLWHYIKEHPRSIDQKEQD